MHDSDVIPVCPDWSTGGPKLGPSTRHQREHILLPPHTILLYYPGSIDIITYLRGQRSIWFNWHQPRLLKPCYSKRSSDPLIKHFVCTRFQRSSKKKKTWANAERPVVTVVRLYNLKKAARLKILRYTLHNINL